MVEDTNANHITDAVGSASFWNDEDEFIASRLAQDISAHSWFGTRTHRWIAITWGHLVLLMGLLLASISPTSSPELRWLPGVLVMSAFGLVMTVLGGRVVYAWLYGGYNRGIRNAFRDEPTAGLRLSYTFTPKRLISHSAKSDSSRDLRLFDGVLELVDGFMLIAERQSGTWIPKRALEPSFDASAFLRSKFAKYRVLDRVARCSIPNDPRSQPDHISPSKGEGPIIGSVAFRWTQDEFSTGFWSITIASTRWRRSRFLGAFFIGGWHLALAIGIYQAFGGWKTPHDHLARILASILALASALVLWRNLYGVLRQFPTLFARFSLANKDVSYTFTPERFISHNWLIDASSDWSLFQEIVEFTNGFVVRIKNINGGHWIPDHALKPPFDHQQAAAFLRSRGVKYRVIDRAVERGA